MLYVLVNTFWLALIHMKEGYSNEESTSFLFLRLTLTHMKEGRYTRPDCQGGTPRESKVIHQNDPKPAKSNISPDSETMVRISVLVHMLHKTAMSLVYPKCVSTCC